MELIMQTNTEHKYKSFQNPQVILSLFNDKRLASVKTSACWFEQNDQGPTFIVIRPNATDDQLIKLSKRFSMEIEDMKSFRDTEAI